MVRERWDALRLADALCAAPERSRTSFEAAAELRRLQEAYECNTAILRSRTQRMNEAHALNAELLEALKRIDGIRNIQDAQVVARAAIAKAEGASNPDQVVS